jgi:hypothetical protein
MTFYVFLIFFFIIFAPWTGLLTGCAPNGVAPPPCPPGLFGLEELGGKPSDGFRPATGIVPHKFSM